MQVNQQVIACRDINGTIENDTVFNDVKDARNRTPLLIMRNTPLKIASLQDVAFMPSETAQASDSYRAAFLKREDAAIYTKFAWGTGETIIRDPVAHSYLSLQPPPPNIGQWQPIISPVVFSQEDIVYLTRSIKYGRTTLRTGQCLKVSSNPCTRTGKKLESLRHRIDGAYYFLMPVNVTQHDKCWVSDYAVPTVYLR